VGPQILLALSIEERHQESLTHELCETIKGNVSVIENHDKETTLHYVIRIHGDLPTLKIALNKEMYSALMEAVASMTKSQEANATCRPKATSFQGHQRRENTSLHTTVTMEPTPSNFCDECCVFNKAIYEIGVSNRFHSMYTKKCRSNISKERAISPKNYRGESSNFEKKGLSCQITTSKDSNEYAIPFEVQASFSLFTFQLSVDCSQRFKEKVDVVTDRTIIVYQQTTKKSFQLKIRDLTLFRTQLSPLSPYYKLLTTYSLSAADSPSLHSNSDKEKVINEDVLKCFIFVDITLSSYDPFIERHVTFFFASSSSIVNFFL
jgi:hypothetical protein